MDASPVDNTHTDSHENNKESTRMRYEGNEEGLIFYVVPREDILWRQHLSRDRNNKHGGGLGEEAAGGRGPVQERPGLPLTRRTRSLVLQSQQARERTGLGEERTGGCPRCRGREQV